VHGGRGHRAPLRPQPRCTRRAARRRHAVALAPVIRREARPMTSMKELRAVFSPDRVTYRNFPAACAREDYERTVERYVDRARRVPGVVGIGRYGNVSIPGISD